MGARVYLPQIGRFLQPDPVVGGSANPYDYAYQDPVNQLDLDGRCPFCKALWEGGKKIIGSGSKRAKRVVRGGGAKPRRVSIRFEPSAHAIARMGLRNVTHRELRNMIRHGTIYYDNKHANYTFVIRLGHKGFMRASYDPLTGTIRTVIKRLDKKFNANNPRWYKIDRQ